MLKNKKFILISVLTFILLVLSINSCFASSLLLEPPVSDSHPYYIIWQVDNTFYSIVFRNTVTSVQYSISDVYEFLFFVECDASSSDNYYYYTFEGSSWVPISFNDVPNIKSSNYYNTIYYIGNYGSSFLSCLKYSNFDIVNRDSEEHEVVFQRAPLSQQVTSGETQAVVANQLEGVQMNLSLMEVVGLLPLAIGFVVLVIGLRKALQTLFQVLKNS